MAIHLEHIRLKVQQEKEEAQRCNDCEADYFVSSIRCPSCDGQNLIDDPISTIIIKSEAEDVYLYVRNSELDEMASALDKLTKLSKGGRPKRPRCETRANRYNAPAPRSG